jgi:hypothetical protein
MTLNITEFVNVIIPSILTLTDRNDYYVKGGRVYDIYFKDKSNSIDWDIKGNRDFQTYIESKCNEYSQIFGVKLLKRESKCPTIEGDTLPMVQYGFEGYEAEKGDPFILDILIDDNFKPLYTKINNINYMIMIDFVKDLLITLDERSSSLNKYYKVLKDTSFINEEVNQYNKLHNTHFNLENLELQYTDYLKTEVNKIKSDKVKKIIFDNIIDPINKDKEDIQDILEKSDATAEETAEMDKFVDFFEDFNSSIVSNIVANGKNKLESVTTSKKYIKTKKRTQNVLNITWENLTNEYKIYLINECVKRSKQSKEITLFDVNETCKAILNCTNNQIKKETSTCIKNQKQIDQTDQYVK